MVMMIPVAILAVLATVGGFIQTSVLGLGPSAVSGYLDKVVTAAWWETGRFPGGYTSGFLVAISLLTMVLAAALFVGALRMRPWSAVVPWAQRLLERKYYFDEIYNAAFVRTMDAIASIGYRDVEKVVIDGAVVGTGEVAEATAGSLRLTQSGYFRNYVLVFIAGALIAAVLLLVRTS
jgi:NADH-quinone oxidoreductase subunit L